MLDVFSHVLNKTQIQRDYSYDALIVMINEIMEIMEIIKRREIIPTKQKERKYHRTLRQPQPFDPLARSRSVRKSRLSGRSLSPHREGRMTNTSKGNSLRSSSVERMMSSSPSARDRGGSNAKTRKIHYKRKHASSSRKADRGTM